MEITIIINSIEDAKNNKPIVDGLNIGDITEATTCTIGILEKGTKGGQTSLMFILQDADGKAFVAQCTANQFEGIIGAFRGAVQRFSEK